MSNKKASIWKTFQAYEDAEGSSEVSKLPSGRKHGRWEKMEIRISGSQIIKARQFPLTHRRPETVIPS